MIGVDAEDRLDFEDLLALLSDIEEELGVDARVILVPGSRRVTVNGFLARGSDELLVRLVEAAASETNIEPLVLACCS